MTGKNSSDASLLRTRTSTGLAAALWIHAISNALDGELSPQTRIRPVFARRWETTRRKPGSFSTPANKSRTKGRTIALTVYQHNGPAPVTARFIDTTLQRQ